MPQHSLDPQRRFSTTEQEGHLVRGLKAFILENKRFPDRNELLKSVNKSCFVRYTRSWLSELSLFTRPGFIGIIGWKNIARNHSVYEAAIIDGVVYTDYPFEVSRARPHTEVIVRTFPEEKTLAELSNDEIIMRIASLTTELSSRSNSSK